MLLCWLLCLQLVAAEEQDASEELNLQLKVVSANGVQLHYLERGQGAPLIFVHGGLGDYREWLGQIGAFSGQYRVIDYSRRYDYPNTNPEMPSYSASTDASDLAGLMDALKLERVHLVSYSYGAFASLFFAVQHPERVRSLTLSEPPIFNWLPDLPGGQEQLDHFMAMFWKPVADAFRGARPEEALRITCDYFGGKGSYEALPPEVRSRLASDLPEWKALIKSRDAFPDIDRKAVKGLTVPTLLITGEKTLPEMRMITYELSRLLPEAKVVGIPGATHDMWIEAPEACRNATLKFIGAHER
jgi:pimeloyl-ACP methyl ester carboxylesterase